MIPEPGGLIVDQIVSSVAKSKRTIIVLSRGFVEDKMTDIQFRAAMAQSLQDKTQVCTSTIVYQPILILPTQRIILLLLHGQELSEDLLSDHLRSYIRLNTYLSTKDKCFWQKLR